MNRITPHVNLEQLGDKEYFEYFLETSTSDWFYFLGNNNDYVDKAVARGKKVVIRIYDPYGDGNIQGFDGDFIWLHPNARDVAKLMSERFGRYKNNPNVYILYAMNELAYKDIKFQMQWMIEFGDEAVSRGFNVILGGWSTPKTLVETNGHFTDIESGIWDGLLEFAHNNRDHIILDFHDYTVGRAWSGNVGDKGHFALLDRDVMNSTPRNLAWDKDTINGQYHIGRQIGLVNRARRNRWRIRLGVGESIWDNMDDIREIVNIMKDAWGLDEFDHDIRGLISLYDYYKWLSGKGDAFTSEDFGNMAWEDMVWIDQQYPDEFEYFAVFAYNDNSSWKSFNLADMRARQFMENMRTYNSETVEETPEEPEEPDMTTKVIDIALYMQGDGRVYDVAYNFPGASPATGTERMQTQSKSDRFYHVKGHPNSIAAGKQFQWEEIWYDETHIWRGTDTSPNEDELYQIQSLNKEYGARWMQRFVSIGDTYFSQPEIIFRYKSNGENVQGKDPYIFPHWIKLTGHYETYTSASGFTLSDVIELSGYFHDPVNNKPGEIFERYYYAKGYGLIGWSDPSKNWHSGISKIADDQQTLPRLELAWLTEQPLSDLPDGNNTEVPDDVITYDINIKSIQPSAGTNVRQSSSTTSSVVAVIKEYEVIKVSDDSTWTSQESDGIWKRIVLQRNDDDLYGWVRTDVVEFQEIEEPATLATIQLTYDDTDTTLVAFIAELISTIDWYNYNIKTDAVQVDTL